ncbi:uncharacterized protein [Coffea arabica]|uniref:Uncharacterized protein isoform X3 n=1 Tax=Coffea arabica TaxID=13443 RepID=A0ABM4UVR6_COFAR
MANQGAKKRKEENARHMKNLLYVIIISNVVYLVIRAGFMYSTFKWKHAGGLLLTAFAYIIPYQQLYAMSMPSYGEDGELIDGGFDMSTGGICGYQHLQHTSSLVLSKDFYPLVQRYLSHEPRMKRRAGKERRWRKGLQEENLSKLGHDNLD